MEGNKKPAVSKPAAKVKVEVILKNTKGEEVAEKDYFFGGIAFPGFQKACGLPVTREDLLDVFHKTFKPEDNFLFYKSENKEVYIVIVPLKFSSSVSLENGSVEGDCQKHAISFIGEGSVNIETLKAKLKKIVPFVRYADR